MFKKKPVIAVYDDFPQQIDYLNILMSDDGKCHSFRCPNPNCGKEVKLGYPLCPFCNTKLKWKYPFHIK